jgi:polyphosphate kinase
MTQAQTQTFSGGTLGHAGAHGTNNPAGDPFGRFLNRELSWLEFNRRVLHEALDSRTPLLERVGFLAIFNSNLDEFFQKRVGGLKRQIEVGVISRTPDGMSPKETLAAIRTRVTELLRVQAECYRHTLVPALAEEGIHLLRWDQLTDGERVAARDYFQKNLFPVLTPLAVDPGHPFPFISNLSMSLGVMLRHPASGDGTNGEVSRIHDGPVSDLDASGLHFARVKVPKVLPRWVQLASPDAGQDQFRFVSLEQIIRHNLQDLFEGMSIAAIEPFRITRNADIEREEEDAEDLLEMIEQELRDRRFARVVRLEVDDQPFTAMNRFLQAELGLDDSDVYQMPAELDYTDLWTVHRVNKPQLKYEPWTPVVPPRLADDGVDFFSVIRAGDVLVHHPYDSFSASVERFIRAAVRDPKVIAIKLTLYRTSEDSPFIPELIRAAESGKQVVALIELKARFDEERNVSLAQKLEKAGIHVVYGIVGYKTHTKTALVVRHESDGMRVYCHIGTGNYNSKTATLYTDLGLFTCNAQITADLVELFHYLTGRSVKRDFRQLLIAPTNMRSRFVELIDREIAHCDAWKQRGADPADPHRPRIVAKMNSLEDTAMCEKLYEASAAGVRIELIVRGFCCLRPGVPGMSENITVMSVIGRFLEHSRIYCFHNAGEPEYFIGSADWMYRNLNNRVECITPILDTEAQKRLRHILDVMLADRRQAWDMQPDGSYVQREPRNDDEQIGTHQRLMNEARREGPRTA